MKVKREIIYNTSCSIDSSIVTNTEAETADERKKLGYQLGTRHEPRSHAPLRDVIGKMIRQGRVRFMFSPSLSSMISGETGIITDPEEEFMKIFHETAREVLDEPTNFVADYRMKNMREP